MPSRLVKVALAVAAAGLVLGGCSDTAGDAAVVGTNHITETALADQVQAVLSAQAKPADTADAELAKLVLDRMIKVQLVDLLAVEAGIEVTPGMIQAQLQEYDTQAGGRKQVEAIFLESNIAPSQIDSVVKLNLQAQELSRQLAPEGDANQQQAMLIKALGLLSDSLGTQVSPRYGTWDPQNLLIGAVPNDLSQPASA